MMIAQACDKPKVRPSIKKNYPNIYKSRNIYKKKTNQNPIIKCCLVLSAKQYNVMISNNELREKKRVTSRSHQCGISQATY